jgi:hypothetical protein
VRRTLGQLAIGVVAGAVVLAGAPSAAHAATGATAGGKDVCGHVLPAQDLQAGRDAATASTAGDAAAVARYKATHDLFAGLRPSPADAAAAAAHDARKEALLRSGPAGQAPACAATVGTMTAAATSGQITWMYQYKQDTPYWCGPAVVEEMSATVPGSSPYNLSQATIASYMGTTTNGTGAGQEVNGLNHFVGVPDFGYNFYGMVWISDPPSAAQKTDFYNHLVADVAVSSPVAGLAWEVVGGPHLVGHPANQNIGHWIEIGGYNSTQVWYADSATSVWSSVPRYSWYDTNNMEIILGGAGYIW